MDIMYYIGLDVHKKTIRVHRKRLRGGFCLRALQNAATLPVVGVLNLTGPLFGLFAILRQPARETIELVESGIASSSNESD